jgi:hypothetical protein
MNNENNQKDQEWLDALAGKPKPGMDPLDAAQALAVRNAILERRNEIEADASHTDAAQLDRLRKRLVQEGLMEPVADNSTHSDFLRRFFGLFGASGQGGSMAIPLWGVAAVMVIVVAVVIQTGTPTKSIQDTTHNILRGGTATVLIVDDPQARLAELQAGLRDVKANFEVKKLEENRWQVDIKADMTSLTYLDAQRISPTVKDGTVRILIQRPAGQVKP